MTLRELKRERTRDDLFESAVELFGDKGYDATTMDEIAAGAGVSRATAFNYFPRKDDLLLEWVRRRRAAVEAQAQKARADGDGADHIKRLVLALADPYTRGRSGRAMVQAWLSTGGPMKPEAWASATLIVDLVRDGQQRGVYRADIDAGVAGRLMLNAFFGALYQWASQQEPASWLRREVEAAFALIVVAISPERQRQLLIRPADS